MADLLNWLWQGGIVALAAWAILRLLERSRARFRYALCWIVLVIVLALPVFPFISLDVVSPHASESAGAFPTVTAIVSVPNTWWTSTAILLGLWAFWTGIHGIRLTRALLALRRAKRHCRPFPESEETALGYWSAIRGRGRQTRLVVSEDVRSAAVLGCGSPVIAIAPTLARHLDTSELDLVVMHEWAHVQNRDDLLNVVQLSVWTIAGWHPAVWWLDRQLRIEREAACDETAVAMTGCVKGYAASLAKTASLLPTRRSLTPVLGALSAPGFRKRIVRILAYRRLVSARWSAGAAMTGALSVLGVAVTVAGLRIVGTAALVAPFDARSIVGAHSLDNTAEIASTVRASESRARRLGSSAPKSTHGPVILPETARMDSAAREVMTESVPSSGDTLPAPTQNDLLAIPQLPAPGFNALSLLLPGASGNAITIGVPPTSPLPVPARTATPWGAAADVGVSVGRASQKVAVSTAGFFSRVGKQIAGSFSDR